ASCSASRRAHRCAKGSSGLSPGTESTPAPPPPRDLPDRRSSRAARQRSCSGPPRVARRSRGSACVRARVARVRPVARRPGARIAGRLFGYLAASLWVLVPYLGIVFVEVGYHQKYTELTLPQVLGLTSVPDFPAMVALIVSAYLCLRALDSERWEIGALAGLAA